LRDEVLALSTGIIKVWYDRRGTSGGAVPNSDSILAAAATVNICQRALIAINPAVLPGAHFQ
jgi:hypothetical protein